MSQFTMEARLRFRPMIMLFLTLFMAVGFDYRKSDAQRDMPLFLLDNGLHVSFVVPKEAYALAPQALREILGNAPQSLIGWGDRGFYMEAGDWENLSAGLIVEALFWPSDSVIYIASVNFPPQKIPEFILANIIHRLELSGHQYRSLLLAIGQEIANPTGLGAGQMGGGQFYLAQAKYHALFTCNSWISKRLREIGVASSPALSIFSWSLMREQRWRN